MDQLRTEQRIYRLFRLSILLKGIFSLGETIAGVLILAIPNLLLGIVISASQDELVEEPGDFIATHSLQLAQQFSVSSTVILGLYLLSRGLIKAGLVAALLKNQLWAYPASLAVLGAFILYQLYEIIIGHSLLIVMLTAFDLIVVYLIWWEYRIVHRHFQSA